MELLISIIVPVYNVSKYLPQCLDSVIHQTYQNLDIIVVDDGSTDGSGPICDFYEGKDPRIRVFRSDHRGVSAARNIGIGNAKGAYITFIDSDDWVEPDTIEAYVTTAVQTEADITCVYSKHQIVSV